MSFRLAVILILTCSMLTAACGGRSTDSIISSLVFSPNTTVISGDRCASTLTINNNQETILTFMLIQMAQSSATESRTIVLDNDETNSVIGESNIAPGNQLDIAVNLDLSGLDTSQQINVFFVIQTLDSDSNTLQLTGSLTCSP